MPFSKRLSVGNSMLGATHRTLNNKINVIVGSIAARDVSALSDAFDSFEKCLNTYFLVEEQFARAVNFDFTRHKLTHQNLLKDFRFIKEELLNKNGIWSEHEEKCYIQALKNSLVRYVEVDIKPLRLVCDTCLDDFKIS
ncbi:MAG: hypothetical protein PHP70_03845 [Gallionella sp.]|nr:hypothetical protein [Gallionella sp.]